MGPLDIITCIPLIYKTNSFSNTTFATILLLTNKPSNHLVLVINQNLIKGSNDFKLQKK